MSHEPVNHNKSFVDGDVHTNTLENIWKHLKKMIDGTYFHFSFGHFDNYLNEHAFRWNLKKESIRDQVNRLLESVVGYKLSYKMLIGRNQKQSA